jgi:hypothetical protein
MNTQDRSRELAANALTTLAKALDSGDSQTLANYLSVMARFHILLDEQFAYRVTAPDGEPSSWIPNLAEASPLCAQG